MSTWILISCFVVLICLAMLIILYPLQYAVKKTVIPLTIASIIVLTAGAYHHWGAFSAWEQYNANEIAKQNAKTLLAKVKSTKELIEKLKTHLDNTPASARGWYLLGRLYVAEQDFYSARDAFAKAYQLSPQDEAVIINYATSLWQLNQQKFNEEVRDLFKQLLQLNPNQPDALSMLAVDAYENKHFAQAINYWQQLLKLVPPDSKDAQVLRQAIVKARQ